MQLNSEAETVIPRAGLLKDCSWSWYALLETPTLDSQLCFMSPCHCFAGTQEQLTTVSWGLGLILSFVFCMFLIYLTNKYWGGKEPKWMYGCSFICILLSVTPTSRVSSIARGTIYSLGPAWARVNKDRSELIHIKLKVFVTFFSKSASLPDIYCYKVGPWQRSQSTRLPSCISFLGLQGVAILSDKNQYSFRDFMWVVLSTPYLLLLLLSKWSIWRTRTFPLRNYIPQGGGCNTKWEWDSSFLTSFDKLQYVRRD